MVRSYMLLKLKNVGMIEKAEIKLDGLTVIAGENCTGKSTVGKVLFSILNTLNNKKCSKQHRIKILLRNMYSRDRFYHRRIDSEVDKDLYNELYDNTDLWEDDFDNENITAYLEKQKENGY